MPSRFAGVGAALVAARVVVGILSRGCAPGDHKGRPYIGVSSACGSAEGLGSLALAPQCSALQREAFGGASATLRPPSDSAGPHPRGTAPGGADAGPRSRRGPTPRLVPSRPRAGDRRVTHLHGTCPNSARDGICSLRVSAPETGVKTPRRTDCPSIAGSLDRGPARGRSPPRFPDPNLPRLPRRSDRWFARLLG